jgi:ABC-type phosphate/phosphonate transport system substrate-binding protein
MSGDTITNGSDCSVAKSSKQKLRMMTYLYPGLPLELYQTYQRYLETVLGCRSYLSVETRWSAPPCGELDPFTADDIDLAFMCSTGYVRMQNEHNRFMELLPVAPVHDDPKNDRLPVYFSEVIIRKDKADKCKEFVDLNGHRWATSDAESLSHFSVLAELKRLGVNASFFGHIIHSESYLDSIRLVLNNIADMAAIDSNALWRYFREHPEAEAELHIMSSLGPWPIPPIVVNSRLPAEVKTKIADSLLHAMDHPEFEKKFKQHGIVAFASINSSFYDRTREILDLVTDRNLHPTYY